MIRLIRLPGRGWTLVCTLLVAAGAPLAGQTTAAGAVGIRLGSEPALSVGVSGRHLFGTGPRRVFAELSVVSERGPRRLRDGFVRDYDPEGRHHFILGPEGPVEPRSALLDGVVQIETSARLGLQVRPGLLWQRRVWGSAGAGYKARGESGWIGVVAVGAELAGWSELGVEWRSASPGVRIGLHLRPGGLP